MLPRVPPRRAILARRAARCYEGPVPSPGPRLPPWAPYAAASLWLLVGWLNLVRGAAHPGVDYRPWAFDHHSYTDILAMGGDRYFHGGRPVPYLEDRIEYPPLLGLVIWGASFAPGGPAGYLTASYLLLALCCLLCVWLLRRIPGADPWWYAGTPALAYLAGLNWDQIPIALLLAALLAHLRGRAAGAGGLAGLGAAAKLWPAALVPGAAAALLRSGGARPLLRAALAFAAVFLAVNLPLALLAPRGLAWFWRYNAGRCAENSAWEALRHLPSLAGLACDPAFLDGATALLLALACAFAAACAFRAPPDAGGRPVRLAAALVLVAWIAVNKVWSPQYFLYAFAAAAVAAAPFRLFWPMTLLAAADYHLAFEVRSSRALLRWHGPLYVGEEIARTLFLLGLAAWLGVALWREARRERPA
jgi:hypothetical protein